MIYENIVALCKERKVTIHRLERECGFGNATIRGWAVSSPSIAKVQKVAEFFGVTVNDLIENKQGAAT